MNYYQRHLGDYARDTAHLSMIEHGAYTMLLDRYYATEQGIPEDQAYRVARARTREEKSAVSAVLAEFFTLEEGVWVQRRVREEIHLFAAGEPEREVKKANEDNRLKRHREERARLFKELTDAGQHAPWNVGMTELRALVNALAATAAETYIQPLTATGPATAPATPATATHTPNTKHQTPEVKRQPPDPRKRGHGVIGFTPGFDEFWSAFPRKVAKRAAGKAFARLRVDPALLAKMLQALQWQRQQQRWTVDDGQFIPHPATWLNDRRWEDEEPSGGRGDLYRGAV